MKRRDSQKIFCAADSKKYFYELKFYERLRKNEMLFNQRQGWGS